jgi:hypothetical protein
MLLLLLLVPLVPILALGGPGNSVVATPLEAPIDRLNRMLGADRGNYTWSAIQHSVSCMVGLGV